MLVDGEGESTVHGMDVIFAQEALEQLEADASFTAGYEKDIVRAYRKRMQFVRAAVDERDLYAWKSLRFEKLQGRGEQRSLRLNKQWRLIVEIVKGSPKNKLLILSIEDYH